MGPSVAHCAGTRHDSPQRTCARRARLCVRGSSRRTRRRSVPGSDPGGGRTLATTGRRSGTPRRTCLIYGTSGGEYVVVASKGGADEHPAWFLNLEADPSVGVQAGTRRFTARARAACSAERATLWVQMAEIFPLYDDYAQKTDREIPIVLLTPLDGPR